MIRITVALVSILQYLISCERVTGMSSLIIYFYIQNSIFSSATKAQIWKASSYLVFLNFQSLEGVIKPEIFKCCNDNMKARISISWSFLIRNRNFAYFFAAQKVPFSNIVFDKHKLIRLAEVNYVNVPPLFVSPCLFCI